jgi:2'-5' RNA ligase
MRLFLALELPPPVIAELEAMRQRLQRGGNHPVKWVASSGFHLTLRFLGEVEEVKVPDILAAVEQAQQTLQHTPPLHLHLAAAGGFPNAQRPKTLWVGVGGNLPLLNRLYDALGSGLEPLGFAPESRPFHAHLTLGRVRRDASAGQIATLGKALAALPAPAAVAWESGPPLLFQSTLTPKGAVYRVVGGGHSE